MRTLFGLGALLAGGYLLYSFLADDAATSPTSQPPRDPASGDAEPPVPPAAASPVPATSMPMALAALLRAQVIADGYIPAGPFTYDQWNYFFERATGNFARSVDDAGVLRSDLFTLDEWWSKANTGLAGLGPGRRWRRA
jgi:hypothetical protein